MPFPITIKHCLFAALAGFFCRCDFQTAPHERAPGPRPLSPRDGQAIDPAEFRLVWSSDTRADGGGWKNYLVQLSSDASFNGDALIMQAWAQQDTVYPCMMMPHHGVYYWRVGESLNALDDDVHWSETVTMTYRDTTRDIDFLDPEAGQYSEWKSPGIGEIRASSLRMWISGNRGDTADLSGMFNGSLIQGQLVRTDSGIFYHSSRTPSDPEYYLSNANNLAQGLATRNRAKPVHWTPDMIDSPQPEYYAEYDSDFVFRGIHFGEADLLITTTPSYAESPDYLLAIDKHGHLVTFGEFGDAPIHTFILLPKPASAR